MAAQLSSEDLFSPEEKREQHVQKDYRAKGARK